MSWKIAPEVHGEPGGWSADEFPNARAARLAGAQVFDGIYYTAFVKPMSYAALLPLASVLLADWREQAAERNADVSSFDSLTQAQVEVLNGLLHKGVENWEAWAAAQNPGARCSVVFYDNLERHEPAREAA